MQGEKLKIERIKAGNMTQKQLSEKSGIKERRIVLIEGNRSIMSFLEALRISEALGIDPGHLDKENFGVFAEIPAGGSVSKYVNGCKV